MSTIRKDNSGYDLKQLFIGSEGTLGVITEAAINCPTMDPPKQLALLSVSSFDKCVELLKNSRLAFGDSLSAFEFIDIKCLEIMQKAFQV